MNVGPDLAVIQSPRILATAHRFLWLPESRTAVLSDVHLGAAAELAARGMHVPEVAKGVLQRRWEAVVARGPERVIVAGDLFDSPGVGAAAIEEARGMFRQLPAECQVTVIAGNHDPLNLGDAIPGVTVEQESVTLGSITISHGHLLPQRRGTLWVTGHQHPAVVLATRVQAAKMACYAVCALGRDKQLVLLPAFSHAPLGSNLLSGRNWLLPIPRPDATETRIFGVVEPAPPREPQVLDFGWMSMLG
jgi:putative SbcD/Mre11-related phosphoesterase